MDTGTPKSTPEEVAQSETRKDRKERKERKERKKLGHEAKRNNPPPPQSDNSSFLARPWIKLPEVSETLIQYRVRVMTWNVCPILSGHSVETQPGIQLLAQCLVRALVGNRINKSSNLFLSLRPGIIPNEQLLESTATRKHDIQ
jgi:hypothetical protein